MNTKKIERQFYWLRTTMAILISLAIAFVIIFFVSSDPLLSIKSFILGPMQSLRRLGNVVEYAIPLFFTGTAMCIMFSANQSNLAVEGAFFIGGVGATAIAISGIFPAGIHPAAAIIFGGLVGSIATLIPALLYVKWNAKPVVSSIMINYVCLYVGLYFINHKFRDAGAGYLASYEFLNSSRLPKIISGTRIHFGLIIAIAVFIFGYIYLYRSKQGYAVRMIGKNPNFAVYSGINVNSLLMICQFIGGFIAGIGGASEVLGMYTRFQYQSLTNHGFDGVIIAVLAKNNPLAVPVAALFLAYIRAGADVMSRNTNVPIEIIYIIQSAIILLMAAERFFEGYKNKKIIAETKKRMAAEGGGGI